MRISGHRIGLGDHNGRDRRDRPRRATALALGNAQELLVLAAFCDNGTPSLDTRVHRDLHFGQRATRVDGGAPGERGDEQQSPSPIIKLGESALSEDDGAPAGSTCDAVGSAPKLTAGGGAVDLVYTFDGAEREANESIILSTMVTDGELDRQYSSFDPDEAAPKEIRVSWTPPPLGRVPPAVASFASTYFYATGAAGRASGALRCASARTEDRARGAARLRCSNEHPLRGRDERQGDECQRDECQRDECGTGESEHVD